MASRWHCMVLGQEMGPLSFQDLVGMIRSGALKEDDPVRREGSSDWTAGRDVIGLFRAAEKEPTEETTPRDSVSQPQDMPLPLLPKKSGALILEVRRLGKRGVIFGCGVVTVIATTILVWGWWSGRHPTFPEPRLGKPWRDDETLLKSALGPRPEVPSVPGLKERVARPIPGLEEIDPAFSACLTPDLRTIVFSGTGNPGTGYDLYLATRESPSGPFGTPRLIESCVSAETDAYPALSPDGLELIFRRSDTHPQYCHATRNVKSGEFQDPVLWAVPEQDGESQVLDRPQFIDRLHLVFCAVDSAAGVRSFYVAERESGYQAFGVPRRIPFPANLQPYYFFSESGLRAYFALPEGFFVSFRHNKSEPFRENVLIVGAERTGLIQGPIWVSPREDVAFFCSPGPGEEPGSGRKLWMIRF
ncbi:MAG: DUF4339 domain-containing protein [Planctomycetes bacterium]|nr:DUF4339 domain-containing protein [Planctomycetota bacterium]